MNGDKEATWHTSLTIAIFRVFKMETTKKFKFDAIDYMIYTHFPIIRTGRITPAAEFFDIFKEPTSGQVKFKNHINLAERQSGISFVKVNIWQKNGQKWSYNGHL